MVLWLFFKEKSLSVRCILKYLWTKCIKIWYLPQNNIGGKWGRGNKIGDVVIIC